MHQPGVVSASFKESDTTHPRDIRYFERLHAMVQHEPLSAFTAEELGLLRSLGIVKGAAFQPDERLRRLLADGARLGDGMAKAIAFASRDPQAHVYPDRHWERIFIGGYKFERDGARLLDARTLFHYSAIVVTPAMEAQMVGVGSQYLTTYKDASGAYLEGGQDYRLRLPAGIPAKDFWSVTVYDAETRSLLQNGRPKPSLSTYDQARGERGRLGHRLPRPASAEGQGEELGRDGARKGLVRLPPPVRPAGALLRADLETGRHRESLRRRQRSDSCKENSMQNDTTQAHTPAHDRHDRFPHRAVGVRGGYPTDATVTKLYDELDFQRAVQAYLWAVPLVSFAQWQEAYEKVFGQQDGDLVLTTSFRDKLGILTANDTTPYVVGFLNLQRTGPLVIDYPKGQTAGGILDFWQRPITDLGLTGPDKGEGGKYLVLAPGQEAPRDVDGYRVVRSPTNNLFHGLRVLVTDPKAAEALMAGYQAYPYAQRENPRKTRIIGAQGQKWSGWPESAMEFWRLLAKMLDEEPVHERDRMMMAMIKPLGIEKGKPFRPDARQAKLLEQASVVGEAMARCLSYAKRQPEARIWPGTQWKNAVLLEAEPGDRAPHRPRRTHGLVLRSRDADRRDDDEDPRAGPGVPRHPEGQGRPLAAGRQQLHPAHSAESAGEAVLGLHALRRRDPQLHRHPARPRGPRLAQEARRERGRFRGSPLRPRSAAGKESNWLPTLPGRGWFAYFRFYAPTEPYFDRSWALPDVERVK